MAEETEIVNVGGEGVASEATLLLLLRAMDKGGKSSGDQDKIQQMYNKSQKDGIKIIDTGNDTLKKKNKILKTTNEALKKLSTTLGDAAVSGMFGVFASMKNMSAELLTGGDTLSDFAQHIPLIGGHLGLLTGMIDDNLSAFRELSAVGARFGDGLNDIRAASANAAMPLDEFVNLVSQNSMTMKMFGSSVATGASNFAAMSKQLRDGPGKSLMGLGFTSTELNELLIDYAELQAGSFTRDRVQGRISAQNAAKFGEQLNGLAAATGKRRDQIMEEIKASQADIRMRAAMTRYQGEEGERFRANIGTVSGISKSLGDALLDFDDGIPSNASTQRLMQMSSTFEQFGQDVENMDPRQLNNFVVDVRKDLEEFARANNTTVEELGRTVPGLQDIFGVISETGNMAHLTVEEFGKIQAAAAEEATKQEGIKQLGETIRQFRGALLDAFIEGDVLKTITSAFDSLGVALSDFIQSDAFKDGLKELTKTIKTFISNFTNFDLKTALFGGKATKDVFDEDGNKVTSKGDDVKGLFGGTEGKGFISTIFSALTEGIFPSIDELIVGLGVAFASFVGLMGVAFLAPISAPFIALGAALIGIAAMIGFDKIKEFVSSAWDSITGVFTGISDWWDSVDLMTPINEMWAKVTGFFTFEEGFSISALFGKAWDVITGYFSFAGEVWTGVGGLFDEAWTKVTGWLGFGDKTWSLSELMSDTWKTVTGFFSFGEEGFSISALATKAWETVTGFFSFGDTTGFSISGLISGAWETITGFFSFGTDALAFSISTLLSTAWETVTSIFSFGTDAAYSIKAVFTTAWETVTGFFSFGDIKLPNIKDMFQGIIDKVKGFFSFDFKLPNFKSFLPTWLGGEGKSLGNGAPDANAIVEPSSIDATPAVDGANSLMDAQSAMASFSNLDGLQNNLDILKSGLDTTAVRSYTDSMKQLVAVLGQLNDELAKDNKFGVGTGENAGSVLSKMDSIGGGGSSSEEVNKTLQLVLAELRTHTTKQTTIADNTRARGTDISRVIG